MNQPCKQVFITTHNYRENIKKSSDINIIVRAPRLDWETPYYIGRFCLYPESFTMNSLYFSK